MASDDPNARHPMEGLYPSLLGQATYALPRTGGPVQQVPSVGRIVHYVAYGTPGGEFPAGVCRAAVITQVDMRPALGENDPPGTYVGLCILNPSGMFFSPSVPYDGNAPGERAAGTWHWCEHVPAR